MSILDTFLILIRSNAKDTEKDMDSLDKKVKQTQENIDKTDKSTRQLGLTFDDFVKALVTASGIDFSIKGLASATKSVVDMEIGLGKLSKLTGVAAGDIDAFDQVLQRVGAPEGSAQNFFSSINAQYQALGQGDKIKNVLPNIIALSDKWKDLNINQKEFYARQLGLTDEIVLAMDKYGSHLGQAIEQQRQLRNITEQDTAASQALANAWKNVGTNLTSFYHEARPVIEWFTHAINEAVLGLRGILMFGKDVANGNWEDILSWGKHPASVSGSIAAHQSGQLPLGIRSNNPGNLQPGGREAIYPTADAGLKAMSDQLARYGQRGINTVSGVVSTWAPPSANDTAAYIADVSRQTGFGADQAISLGDPYTRSLLMQAMVQHENGMNPYSASQYATASGQRTTNVSIGDVTVNTQATDAHGLANDLSGNLAAQMRSAIGSFDDGILY
jgi:hypothetical protein